MTTAVIHMTERYIRVAQVERIGLFFTLQAYGYEGVDPAFFTGPTDKIVQNYANTLQKLYQSLKIKASSIRIVIPDAYTYSQIIEVPKLKEKELLAAIRYQADEFIPLPIEETNLDLEILEEYPSTKKSLVLIVASPKKIVSQIEKVLELCEIEAEILENELAPVGRLISEVIKPKTQGMLLINIGYMETAFYIMNERYVIVMTRSIKIGLYHFTKDLMVNLNLDELHAAEILKNTGFHPDASYKIDTIVAPLISELLINIQKILLLSQSKFSLPITSAFLFNLDGRILGLAEYLSAQSAIPCKPFPVGACLNKTPVAQSLGVDSTTLTALLGATL